MHISPGGGGVKLGVGVLGFRRGTAGGECLGFRGFPLRQGGYLCTTNSWCFSARYGGGGVQLGVGVEGVGGVQLGVQGSALGAGGTAGGEGLGCLGGGGKLGGFRGS